VFQEPKVDKNFNILRYPTFYFLLALCLFTGPALIWANNV
jgi:hypothetical protein